MLIREPEGSYCGEKFKLIYGNRRGNPLAEMGPESPSGDSGLVFGSVGYRGSGLTSGHQWTPQSHLEAYATVFAGSVGRERSVTDHSEPERHFDPRMRIEGVRNTYRVFVVFARNRFAAAQVAVAERHRQN